MATATKPTDAATKKHTLWDIGSDMQALNALIEECGGDVSDPQVEAAFDAMFAEMQRDEANKLEGYAQAIRMLEAEQAAAKAEAAEFAKKAQQRERQIDAMTERVKMYLAAQGRTEAKTARGRTFKIVKNGGMLPLKIDETATPEQAGIDSRFVKIVKAFDNAAIRAELEAGKEVPFARLGDRGTRITLK